MSVEDTLLRWEGLDPSKVHAILADVVHLLATFKTQVVYIQTLLDTVNAELPRIQRVIANIQGQIEAYEANQRRFS